MDNGLIANVPLFIVETLDVTDAVGATLAALTLSEAISDDPTLTLLVDAPAGGETLVIAAHDTGGSTFRARVPIPAPARTDASEPAPARHLEGQL